MSSTYANDQTKTLRRSILWRTILNAVLFTAVYAAAVFLVELFKPALSNFVFYTVLDGVGYTLYNLLSSLYYLVAAGVYLIGMILVIRAGINRALRYFDALFEAVEGMLVEEGSPIYRQSSRRPPLRSMGYRRSENAANGPPRLPSRGKTSWSCIWRTISRLP